MKALIITSMLVDVDSEQDARAVALAIRQASWLSITAKIEANEISADAVSDAMTVFEPVVSFPMDIEART